MDIIPKIKFSYLKADFTTLALKHKLFLFLFLLSLFVTIVPHTTLAALILVPKTQPFIFDGSDMTWQDEMDQKGVDYTQQYFLARRQKDALQHARLVAAVQKYLVHEGSPLSDYAEVLVSLKNWKQIVALSNAESSMCRNYPVNIANCWGVGGSSLMDFGDNLGEGIVAMNQFLNANPRRSNLKYAQMSFDQMNGLYKQPAREHWLYNNQAVYDELAAIEKSIN